MANLEHAEEDPKHVNMSGDTPAVSAPATPAPVAVSCVIPSFAAASELLSAPYSCLVLQAHRRHVALPPVYLKKKKSGLREELENELLRFSQSLNGVPLAYDNISIVGHHGNIYDDSGYIHMDIEANFIVFQPQKGQTLLGKVNKLGVSHVGCLVHGCFNASIPKPNLVPVETWRDAGPRIGADLEFEVTALDADTVGVLLIRGRLSRTSVQELLALGESAESSVAVGQTVPEDAEPAPEPSQESPEETPKKKKKKKKDKVKEEVEEEISTPSYQQDSCSTTELSRMTDEADASEAGEIKKKKKKKKDKIVKEEEEEIELAHMEIQGSDSSGYISDKPNKKRKHDASSDVTSDFSEAPHPKKSKKKKNVDIEQFA